MNLGWLLGKKRPDIRVVIDVGSHSIKAAAFEFGINSGRPKALKKFKAKLYPSFDKKRSVGKVREIIFNMIKHLGRVPKRITVALGSPLSDCELQTWNITEGSDVHPKALARYFHDFFETHRDHQLTTVAYPLETVLNGYPAEKILLSYRNPTGLSKTSFKDDFAKLFKKNPSPLAISFRTFILSSSKEIGEELLEIRRSFGGMSVEFIPLLAAYRETLYYRLGISNILGIDVGGEATTLFLLSDGSLARFYSFPVGGNHFIRSMAKTLGVSWHEAEDQRRPIEPGPISSLMEKKPEALLNQEKDLWFSKFSEALNYFYTAGPLPQDILLLGGGSYISEIVSVLQASEWLKEFSYASTPKIRRFRAADVFEGDTLGGLLAGPEDVGLASLIFYSLHHEPLFAGDFNALARDLSKTSGF